MNLDNQSIITPNHIAPISSDNNLESKCKYLQFNGIFKPVRKSLVECDLSLENIANIIYSKTKKQLDSKKDEGLIALVYNNGIGLNGEGGFRIAQFENPNNNSNIYLFDLEKKGCARLTDLMEAIEKYAKVNVSSPKYLFTDMNIGCCEMHARQNNSLYEF